MFFRPATVYHLSDRDRQPISDPVYNDLPDLVIAETNGVHKTNPLFLYYIVGYPTLSKRNNIQLLYQFYVMHLHIPQLNHDVLQFPYYSMVCHN